MSAAQGRSRILSAGTGQTGQMTTSTGSVRSFDADEGWGIIDGPDVPGGCWVHFSAIAVEGYRELTRGQDVSFRAEAADQDGFAYRAVKVWTGDSEPADQPGTRGGSVAYHSSLTLDFDAPPNDVARPCRGRPRGAVVVEDAKRSPGILAISWGRIEVAGLGVVKDAKLYPGGGREWDWSETGTRHSPGIQPADIEEILLHGATDVVLSRGMDLRLQVGRQVLEFLERRGVAAHVAETTEAVRIYNELAAARPVGGLFHSTC
ncbi:MTH938/NDUFAF3 family protein [Actinoplanes sp. NPDC049668]|uniref:MTH938/NDUFAF3 family protein n=1 Tax=unclassified Actinoplanes TaxID=2626549 RepID=UPI0033A74A82